MSKLQALLGKPIKQQFFKTLQTPLSLLQAMAQLSISQSPQTAQTTPSKAFLMLMEG